MPDLAKLWDDESTHPGDLLEYLEGDLETGRIERKWRLFLCGCARHAIRAAGVGWAEEMVSVSERFADDAIDFNTLDAARQAFRPLLPGLGSRPTPGDYALWAVSGTAYEPGYAHKFDAALSNLDCAADATTDEDAEYREQVRLLKDIFGNPFRPVAFGPAWRSDTAVSLARQMYETRDFSLMPILADALQDAGCEHPDVLAHCRDPDGTHVRGCWVVDLVLGKQ